MNYVKIANKNTNLETIPGIQDIRKQQVGLITYFASLNTFSMASMFKYRCARNKEVMYKHTIT